MGIFSLIIAASWLIFLAYWFIASFSAKKNAPEDSSAAQRAGFRFLMVIIVLIIFSTQLFRNFHLSDILPATATFEAIAAAFSVVGIGLAIWARVHLGKNWGMPMSVKQKPELITTGPFRYIRNPIYSGVILALIGSIFANGSEWSIIALLLIIYFVYSAKTEEKILMREFPETYPAYKRHTKMFIPFIV